MDSLSKKIKDALESDNKKTPDQMYDEYIAKHRQGVLDTYRDIMYDVLKNDGITDDELDAIRVLIDTHDQSKYSVEEWSAYRDHFYDPDNNPRSGSEAFNHAWNHHQKHNPHHWQYWCLINDVDNPQIQALDMPLCYIIELLCDWQSAGKHYGNSAYEWYEKQKDRMILSDKTREIIEKYIVYLK